MEINNNLFQPGTVLTSLNPKTSQYLGEINSVQLDTMTSFIQNYESKKNISLKYLVNSDKLKIEGDISYSNFSKMEAKDISTFYFDGGLLKQAEGLKRIKTEIAGIREIFNLKQTRFYLVTEVIRAKDFVLTKNNKQGFVAEFESNIKDALEANSDIEYLSINNKSINFKTITPMGIFYKAYAFDVTSGALGNPIITFHEKPEIFN